MAGPATTSILPPRAANFPHLLCNFLDDETLGVFRRNIAAHKAEYFAFTRALGRQDSDAVVTHDHELSPTDRRGGNHFGLGIGRADDDGEIHLRVLHVDPVAIEAHLRGQVSGRVEFRRQNPIGGRREIGNIVTRGQHGTERLKGQEDGLQFLLRTGMHLETCEGNFVLGATNLYLLNVKGTAHVHDGVKGAWQGPGIDNVSFESDFFAE